jgi:hypothetical protein
MYCFTTPDGTSGLFTKKDLERVPLDRAKMIADCISGNPPIPIAFSTYKGEVRREICFSIDDLKAMDQSQRMRVCSCWIRSGFVSEDVDYKSSSGDIMTYTDKELILMSGEQLKHAREQHMDIVIDSFKSLLDSM